MTKVSNFSLHSYSLLFSEPGKIRITLVSLIIIHSFIHSFSHFSVHFVSVCTYLGVSFPWVFFFDFICMPHQWIEYKFRFFFLYLFGLFAKSLQLCLTLWPDGLLPSRLFCPWDSPGKNTWAGCHGLLQGIFPTQGSSSVS